MAPPVRTTPDAPDSRNTATAGNPDLAAQQWDRNVAAIRPTGATGGAQDLATCYHQVFDNLQQAETIVETRGMQAALGKYTAAQGAADAVPRQQFERQLMQVEQTLKHGGLNPQQERQLQQQAMDLDSVIRASVFARANLGMLCLRNGHNQDGVRLLLEASDMDRKIWQDYAQMGIDPRQVASNQDRSVLPMMKDDPNFQKHLASALADGARLTGGDSSQVRQALINGLNGQPGDATAGQVGPGRFTPVVNGQTPWQRAEALANQVTGPLQPQDLTSLKQSFVPIIQASDQGESPRLQTMVALEEKLRTGGTQPPQPPTPDSVLGIYGRIKAQVDQNDAQLNAAIDRQTNLSPAQKTQAQQIVQQLEHASTAGERQKLEDKLFSLVPSTRDALIQRDQLMGPASQANPNGTGLLDKLYVMNQLKDQAQAERNQSAMTRFACAEALSRAGDPATARAVMAEALLKNVIPETANMMQREAARLGVTQPDIDAAKQRLAQAQAANPGDGTTGGAQRVQGPPGNPGDATIRTQAVGPVAPGDATAGNPDTRAMAAANTVLSDSPALQTLQRAQQAFDANPDKKAALAAQEANFKQAQDLAEATYAQQYPRLAGIEQQIQAAFPAAAQAEYKQLNGQNGQPGQIQVAVSQLPPADQATFTAISKGQTTQEQAQAFLDAHPDIKAMIARSTQLTQPIVPLLLEEAKISQAMNDKVATATMYARALALAAQVPGTAPADKQALLQKGHDVFIKGFNGVPQDQQTSFLQDQFVKAVAVTVGAIQDNTAAAQPGTPGAPGDVRTQPAAGDQTQRPFQSSGDPVVDNLAQTKPYGTLLQNAHMLIQQNKGDIKAAEPYYKAAIMIADSQDPAQLSTILQQKLTDLNNPNIPAAQRQQDHIDAIGIIGMLRTRVDAHEEYAQMLMSAHRFKDAQDQLEIAKNAATFDPAHPEKSNFPSNLIQQEIVAIQKDLNNTGIPEDVRGQLSAEAARLQSTSQYPIAIREELAQFYLAGGKNPNGESIGTPMIVGYNANGQPLPPKNFDTKILDPQKASDLINEALALQTSINSADIVNHPELDQNLAALRVAVINNAPASLKEALEKSSHYWQNASSTFWSTAVGLAVAGTALYLTAKGDAGAFEQLNAGRLALAGIGGFTAASATNYGIQKMYFHRDDWTPQDSLLQGGGTFLAAGGLLLTRNAVLGAKAANYTAETVTALAPRLTGAGMGLAPEAVTLGNLAIQSEGLAGQLGKVNELVAGLTKATPTLQRADALAKPLSEIIAAGGENAKLAEGLQQALGIDAKISLGRAAQIATGNGLQRSSQLGGLIRDYGQAANYTDLSILAKNQAKLSELVAAAGGDSTKLAQLVKAEPTLAGLTARTAEDATLLAKAAEDTNLARNVGEIWGTDNMRRMGMVFKLAPKELAGTRILGTGVEADAALKVLNPPLAAAAENTAVQGGRLARTWARVTNSASETWGAVRSAPGNTWNWARNADYGQLLPWKPMSAEVLPTNGARMLTRMQAGTAAGLTFNLGSGYVHAQTNYNKGDTTVTPWEAMKDQLKIFDPNSTIPFTTIHTGINFQNVVLQSMMFAPMLGGLKVGTPMARSMGEAWQAARFANAKPFVLPAAIGAGTGLYTYSETKNPYLSIGAAGAGFFGSRLLPLGPATEALKVLPTNLYHGVFNVLNPAETATLSQTLRQTIYPTAAYMQSFEVLGGALTIPQQRPWRDALEEIGRPITNETNYVAPTFNANGEIVDANAPAQPQRQPVQPVQPQPSAAQRSLNVPVAPTDGQPQPDPNNLNPDLTGGIR